MDSNVTNQPDLSNWLIYLLVFLVYYNTRWGNFYNLNFFTSLNLMMLNCLIYSHSSHEEIRMFLLEEFDGLLR